MIKLLIYDLDGTLIDSCRDIANAVNWTLKELALRKLPIETISSFVGRGVTNLMTGVLKEALKEVGKQNRQSEIENLLGRSVRLYRSHYAKHLLDETKLYPSVQMVLEHFKDRKQAVITNKPEGFSNEILRGLKIDSYFFRVIGGDQKFPKKPAPEPVLEIVRSAGVGFDETVLIGDSAIDIKTGRNAKIKTIAVTYGFSNIDEIKHSAPDFVLNDLAELIRCPLLI